MAMKQSVLVVSAALILLATANGESHDAVIGEIPYIVAIWQVMESPTYTGNNTDFQCAGVLLTSRHVLTSVTCINQSKKGFGAVASAGMLDRGATSTIHYHQIVDVVRHEDYDELTKENDIAMLTVSPAFVDEDNVLPVTLTTVTSLPGDLCTTAGWRHGFFYTSEQLRVEAVEVLPEEACQNLTPSRDTPSLDDDTLCVGNVDAQACIVGDEGGPLICDGRLAGLFSSSSLVCVDTQPEPAVYQDVRRHADWIAVHAVDAAAWTSQSVALVAAMAALSGYRAVTAKC